MKRSDFDPKRTVRIDRSPYYRGVYKQSFDSFCDDKYDYLLKLCWGIVVMAWPGMVSTSLNTSRDNDVTVWPEINERHFKLNSLSKSPLLGWQEKFYRVVLFCIKERNEKKNADNLQNLNHTCSSWGQSTFSSPHLQVCSLKFLRNQRVKLQRGT